MLELLLGQMSRWAQAHLASLALWAKPVRRLANQRCSLVVGLKAMEQHCLGLQ